MDVEGNESALDGTQLSIDTTSVITDPSHGVCSENEQSMVYLGVDTTSLSASLIGVKGSTIEELYHVYCNHAADIGFSVRKGTTRYNVAREIVQKSFVYSCEGIRRNSNINLGDEELKQKPYVTRTNCKASLKLKLNADGLYKVVDHITSHNHALCRKEWSYLHRSQRSISDDKAALIEDMISSGIKAVDSFRYMAHDAGGEHIVGHTKVDHLNFVNQLKMSAIEGGDAQTLIDILYQQCADDQEFFSE